MRFNRTDADRYKNCNICSSAQGHASFTIEFDNTSPGKVTIKDHVSKFTPDHHRSRSKKSGAGGGGTGGRDLSTLQAAMIASESKVADWLAQNDPTIVRRESTEDDSKSIKSDVPVHLKRLKGIFFFCFVCVEVFVVPFCGALVFPCIFLLSFFCSQRFHINIAKIYFCNLSFFFTKIRDTHKFSYNLNFLFVCSCTM